MPLHKRDPSGHERIRGIAGRWRRCARRRPSDAACVSTAGPLGDAWFTSSGNVATSVGSRRSVDAEIARAERSIERCFESFEQGRPSERCGRGVASLQARIEDLTAPQAELARTKTSAPGHPRPPT
jgi:hypothetical protein